jgi:hypothetical protein
MKPKDADWIRDMEPRPNTLSIALAVAAIAVLPRSALGQAAPKPDPEPEVAPPSAAVEVGFRSPQAGLEVEVIDSVLDVPVGTCIAPCRTRLLPGSYNLHVHETKSTVAGWRNVEIAEPSDVTIDPKSRGTRTTGLMLGIGGAVAVFAGALLFMTNVNLDEDNSRRKSGEAAWLGLGMMAAGGIATPIGWTIFGMSFRPGVDVAPAR